MKLVIISPYQFILRRGIEQFVYLLSKELVKIYNIEIIIYTWRVKKPLQWKNWDQKIKIRYVPYIRYFQEYLARLFYWFWVRLDNPECILLNFLFHGEEVLPKNKRYIYVLHYPASQVSNRYKKIKKIAKRFSNLEFVAVSFMVKHQALPYIGKKNISVIYNGVDLDKFYPAKKKINQSNTVRLITLAALEERKGIQFVIEALNFLRELDIKYDIYGDGPYKDSLLLLIKRLQLSKIVTIHNSIDNPQNILKEADIFCLLSKGEAFPMALLEAMAEGLAVIVSQYPPFDEILTENTGIMVEREDPLKVADAIKSLLDKEKRKYLGYNARLLVERKFSLEKMTKQYYEILTKRL